MTYESRYICVGGDVPIRKLGAIPRVYADATTCPPSCPLLGNGCYAESGSVVHLFRDVTRASRGEPMSRYYKDMRTFSEMLDWVRALPIGQMWRYGISGDLPGRGDDIDVDALRLLVRAAAHTCGFCYTHKPVLNHESNRRAIASANRFTGFMINLSADTCAEADALLALGIGPVVVLQPKRAQKHAKTPAGHGVVTCPAVTAGLTCETCGVCAAARRGIIGFPAHGSGAAKVESVALGKPHVKRYVGYN